MNLRQVLATSLAGSLASALICLAPGAALGKAQPGFAIADHHMHILSPMAAHREDLFCDAIGRDQCDEPIEASTGADAIHALDAAGIERGVLLSMAYMAGSPELREPPDEVARDTRNENAYVVSQAELSCGRLSAFISVNPNSANALDEIRYWGHHGGALGLKLHLANSEFDFKSPEQVGRLAAVFRAADAARMPIVIHMRNLNPDYGAEEVGIFLQNVLPEAHDVTVQIAHSGGWGGIDRHTLSALSVFADAVKHDPANTANLYFDIAAMPDLPGEPASDDALSRYVALMREIGLRRFLLASDWVKGADLNAYYNSMRQRLNLSADEWNELASNAAPYLQHATMSPRCAS